MGDIVLYFWGCVGKNKDYRGYPLELKGCLHRPKKKEGVACRTFLLVLDNLEG